MIDLGDTLGKRHNIVAVLNNRPSISDHVSKEKKPVCYFIHLVFQRKEEVGVFITRFLWFIVMHGAVKYPIEPWYTFVPLAPSKVYEYENAHGNEANVLPDGPTIVSGLTLGTLLGNSESRRQ